MKAKKVLVLATAIAFLGVFQISAMAGNGNGNSSKSSSRGTGTCIRTTNSANAVVDDMFKNMFQSGQSGQVQGQGQKGSGNNGQRGSGNNGQRGSGNNGQRGSGNNGICPYI